MKCPICNSPLRDGAVFCPHCGTRVGRSFEFENEFANNAEEETTYEDDSTNPYRFEGVQEETNPDDFEDDEPAALMEAQDAAEVIPDKVEREMEEIVHAAQDAAPHDPFAEEDIEPVRHSAHTPFTAQIRAAGSEQENVQGGVTPKEDIMALEDEITIAPDTGVMQPSAMELLKASKEGTDIYQTRFGAPNKSQEVTGGMQEETASEIARKMAQAQQIQRTIEASGGMTAAQMLTSVNRQKQAEEALSQAQAMTEKPLEEPLTAQEMLKARQLPVEEAIPQAAVAEEVPVAEEPAQPEQEIPAADTAAAQIPVPEGMTPQQAAFYRQQQQMQQAFMRQQQQLQQQMREAGVQVPQQPYGYGYGYPYAYPYGYNPYAAGQTNPTAAAAATAAGIAAESEESAAVFAAASGRQVVTPSQPQGAPAGARTVAAGTAGAAAGMAAGMALSRESAQAAGATGAAGTATSPMAAALAGEKQASSAAKGAADAKAEKGKKAAGTKTAAKNKDKEKATDGDEKKQRTAIYILAAVVGILVIVAFVLLIRRMRGGNATDADLAEAGIVTETATPSEGTEAAEGAEGAEGAATDAAGTGTEASIENIDTLIANGDFEEAIRAIDEAYRVNPSEDLVTYYTMAYRTWSDVLLSEGDYEQAIRQLEEASRIDAENQEVKDATVRAYMDWAETFIQNAEYEEAIAKLDAAEAKATDKSILTDKYVEAYLAWGQYYETEGDLEQALNVLNQGYGKTSSNDIARRYNEIAINADGTAVATGNNSESSSGESSGGSSGGSSSGGSSSGGSSSGGSSSGGSSSGGSSSGNRGSSSSGGSSSGGSSSGGGNIGSYLTNIASASQSGNTATVANNMRDASFKSSAQSLINQYNGPISYDTSGTSVGVYPANNTLMVYVGGYNTSNLRTGSASWYDASGSETYVAEGSWTNDLPNGNYTATWTGSNYEVTYTGNVKNGLWDGQVNIKWTQNGTTTSYTATASNGLFTQVGTDNHGNPVIAKSAGSDGLAVSNSELSTPAGIRGYGYSTIQIQ